VQRVVAYLLELYADEFLLLPAMHYRWSFPESERKARADFAAATGDPAGAIKFADRMSGSIAMLGVRPESHAAIEMHLADLLDALSAHFADTRRCSARACRSPTARCWARSTRTCISTPYRVACCASAHRASVTGSSG